MYFPAFVAKGCNPIVQRFCALLEENGLVPMQVITACMSKLLHIAFGVVKNNCPFDSHYEQPVSNSQQIPLFAS